MAEFSPVLKEGDILEANYWPEPIKVIATRAIGQRLQIFATGLNSRTSYDVTLSQQQVATEIALSDRVSSNSVVMPLPFDWPLKVGAYASPTSLTLTSQ